MSWSRSAGRILLVAALAAVLNAATSAPASALVVPSMGILVSHDASSVTLCADGTSVSAVNAWVFTVEGIRSDGSVVSTVVTSRSWGFSNCYTVTTDGALAGAGTATLSYAGTGTDVAGTFAAYWGWTPATGTFGAGTGIT